MSLGNIETKKGKEDWWKVNEKSGKRIVMGNRPSVQRNIKRIEEKDQNIKKNIHGRSTFRTYVTKKNGGVIT